MKPAPFDYIAARDLPHALAVLAGGEAKILAGGQSLMPMMNFRLVTPAVLLDINRIPGLGAIVATPAGLSIGALVRHRQTAEDPLIARHFPVLAAAMRHVAHHTIRNRGTFVGSLCHADPAAEMPMLALLLNARIVIASARGTRHLDAADFFQGPLMTALEADEMVTGIDLPYLPAGTAWGFEEFARRPGDFALAAVAVILTRQNERTHHIRLGAMGVGPTPLRLATAEAALQGHDLSALPHAVAAARAAVEPDSDQHASGAYRCHLLGVLLERAVRAAWSHA